MFIASAPEIVFGELKFFHVFVVSAAVACGVAVSAFDVVAVVVFIACDVDDKYLRIFTIFTHINRLL